MTPNASNQINIVVQMNAGSDALVLAGLAIREVGIIVNDPGGGDDMNPANGVTTLREAIRVANTTAGADTITFATNMSGATINLGGTELSITEALTIDAAPLAANVTINAQQQSRIFNITATSGDFTLAGLTLTGGQAIASYGGAIRSITSGNLTINEAVITGNLTVYPAWHGGGIHAVGPVTITQSTVSGNSAGGSGGGIFAGNGVTLTQSTVSGNSTNSGADGGGIFAIAAVTLTQSTVSGNSSNGNGTNGGGIFGGGVTLHQSTVSGNKALGPNFNNSGGGIHSIAGVTVSQSTVANNYATSLGGGINQVNGLSNHLLSITGSIIAGNGAGSGVSPDLSLDPQSVAVAGSVSHSLIGNISGSGVTASTGTGNLLDVDPLLGPLADNGGPTQTHALLPGSPAIDWIDPLVRPSGVSSSTSASDFFAAGNLVFGIGLPAFSYDNYSSVQHAGASSTTAWVTQANGADYFAAGTPPVLTFTFLGHHLLTDIVVWGYASGPGVFQNNEAKTLEVSFSADGAANFSAPVTLQHARTGVNNETLSFGGAYLANVVRVRITDNHFGNPGAAGGDRVGLGEITFLGGTNYPTDQRGAAFNRIMDADVFPGKLIDIGAYEAQLKPSADFDANTLVDGNDFLRWQRGLGTPNATRAQGNSDDDADADHSDLAAWRVHFGATGVTSEAAAVGAATPSAAAAVTRPSPAALDAIYAAGDFTTLLADRTAFRPFGKARIRRT